MRLCTMRCVGPPWCPRCNDIWRAERKRREQEDQADRFEDQAAREAAHTGDTTGEQA